jgi:hypothetical protein
MEDIGSEIRKPSLVHWYFALFLMNLMGTHWELEGNMLGTRKKEKKNPPVPPPPQPQNLKEK